MLHNFKSIRFAEIPKFFAIDIFLGLEVCVCFFRQCLLDANPLFLFRDQFFNAFAAGAHRSADDQLAVAFND